MDDGNTRLSVIHPQRDAPVDITYKSSTEFAFCQWCRFFSDYHYMHKAYSGCKNRNINPHPRKPDRLSDCDAQNPDGRCIYYDPDRWTRLIRFFGFRKPVPVARPHPRDDNNE